MLDKIQAQLLETLKEQQAEAAPTSMDDMMVDEDGVVIE